MSIEKHLRLTGVSDVSWKDAINKILNESSKSIDYINSITIIEQKAIIDGKRIIEYHSTVDLCFTVDSSRK